MDPDNMEEIARQAKLSGKQQALRGADFTITGDVVELGRKETGDSQLFGILEPLIVLFGSDTAPIGSFGCGSNNLARTLRSLVTGDEAM
jgi:hypothetical protein